MSAVERLGRRPPRPLTEKARGTFLERLADGYSVTDAARSAGFGRQAAYLLRSQDETFAGEWADAIERGSDVLEDAARRRAVDGVERPIYQGGRLVGTEVNYSDALLTMLLKARRPNVYRDNAKLELATPPLPATVEGGISWDDIRRAVLEEAGIAPGGVHDHTDHATSDTMLALPPGDSASTASADDLEPVTLPSADPRGGQWVPGSQLPDFSQFEDRIS